MNNTTPSALAYPVFVTLSTPVGDLHLALPDDSWSKNSRIELHCVYSGLESFSASPVSADLLELVAAVLADLASTAAILSDPDSYQDDRPCVPLPYGAYDSVGKL